MCVFPSTISLMGIYCNISLFSMVCFLFRRLWCSFFSKIICTIADGGEICTKPYNSFRCCFMFFCDVKQLRVCTFLSLRLVIFQSCFALPFQETHKNLLSKSFVRNQCSIHQQCLFQTNGVEKTTKMISVQCNEKTTQDTHFDTFELNAKLNAICFRQSIHHAIFAVTSVLRQD